MTHRSAVAVLAVLTVVAGGGNGASETGAQSPEFGIAVGLLALAGAVTRPA